MAPLRRQQAPQDDEDLDEGWKITDDMKKAVENSSWLRQQLQDGGLRDLMQKIVASGDGLQQQRYPQFQVFVDKLLVLAGILEREDGENEPLEEWLEQDWSHDPPPLSLRPLRRKLPVFQPVDISSTEEESSEDTGQSGEEEDEEGEENEKSSVENEEEDDEDDDNSHGNNN